MMGILLNGYYDVLAVKTHSRVESRPEDCGY